MTGKTDTKITLVGPVEITYHGDVIIDRTYLRYWVADDVHAFMRRARDLGRRVRVTVEVLDQ